MPQVSHVFVSLVELGLAGVTNKAGAGMVAFGHIVPGLDPVSQLIQAPEKIMINLLCGRISGHKINNNKEC